jgi:hypothetical protein
MIWPGTLHMKDCIIGLGTLSRMKERLCNRGGPLDRRRLAKINVPR